MTIDKAIVTIFYPNQHRTDYPPETIEDVREYPGISIESPVPISLNDVTRIKIHPDWELISVEPSLAFISRNQGIVVKKGQVAGELYVQNRSTLETIGIQISGNNLNSDLTI